MHIFVAQATRFTCCQSYEIGAFCLCFFHLLLQGVLASELVASFSQQYLRFKHHFSVILISLIWGSLLPSVFCPRAFYFENSLHLCCKGIVTYMGNVPPKAYVFDFLWWQCLRWWCHLYEGELWWWKCITKGQFAGLRASLHLLYSLF